MKIVFLDIDGVLITYNKDSPAYVGTDIRFHRPSIYNMNTLIRRTGCKIVISSTWRLLSNIDIVAVFRDEGITGEIIGATPSLENRGLEISAWLNAAADRVTSFVIIDDMYRSIAKLFPYRLVRTSEDQGFDSKALSEALRILNR